MLTNLRIERLRAGLRQVDLAEKVRLPQHRISLIERGVAPMQNEAKVLATALGVSVESLFPEYGSASQL
jgi:transcriptional regulator with XRE-family HTH domain